MPEDNKKYLLLHIHSKKTGKLRVLKSSHLKGPNFIRKFLFKYIKELSESHEVF